MMDRRGCNECGRKLDKQFIERGFCDTCQSNHDIANAGRRTRKFSQSLKWVSSDVGAIVKSKRIFSCEIEAVSPNENWPQFLGGKLPAEMGITTDGSVADRDPRGFEIQTPRLGGKKGEELIQRITNTVKELGAHVDHTCGMHIHLDGKGIIKDRKDYPLELVQLLKSYVVMEDVMMSFLPYSRRRNDYCRPMAQSFQVVELDMIETLPEFEKLWYKQRAYPDVRRAKEHHYHASRYFGANFHSLLANGHFEIRLHSGTTSAKKILEWANLHALLMDACAAGKMNRTFFAEYLATSRLSERTDMLFDQIGLAQPSRQYFKSRQNKFGDKKLEDEEVQGKRKKNSGAPPGAVTPGELDRFVYRRLGFDNGAQVGFVLEEDNNNEQ